MWTLLVIGAVGVCVGLSVAGAMVWRDLGPIAHLGAGQRVLLTASLSIGVIAFCVKLAIIAGFSGHPSLLPPPQQVHQAPAAEQQEESGRTELSAYSWQALPETVPAPANNPTTPEKVALGERLFHDAALSRDGTVACVSCHDVDHGAGEDGRPVAVGISGQPGRRNSPTVFNAAFQALQFWDGRAHSLEQQALGPLLNPIEMGNATLQDVVKAVGANPDYAGLFATAFGPGATATPEHIAMAIAAYERTLITPDSPYDRFVRGDDKALTASQLRGMALFEQLRCVSCHYGPNFSRASILTPEHGAAGLRLFPVHAAPLVAQFGLGLDRGASTAVADRAIWRVPSLRNVSLTGPYFHNGAVSTLEDAIRVMATAQLGRAIGDVAPREPVILWNSSNHTLMRRYPLNISEADIADIAAFLRGLASIRLTRQVAKGQLQSR